MINNIWSDLKLSSISRGENVLGSVSYRYLRKKDGNLVYRNNKAYKSVLIHVAKQTAAHFVEQTVNSLFPKYQRYQEKIKRDKVLSQQESQRKTLIKKGEAIESGLGVVGKYVAQDKYGNRVPEALMIYYEGDTKISVEISKSSADKYGAVSAETENFETNLICFIDLTASVSVQSSKNIILSQVQGRDYTRKELISGGDLTFQISGMIVGDAAGIYPENDVKKFIQIMQYGGIINVNHLFFKQFNVNRIIVKEYSMGNSNCKNVQPYSFSCVAVEPDEDVEIKSDTINTINNEIFKAEKDKWYKLILQKQLSSIAGNVSSTVTLGIDSLVPNI